MSETDSFEHHEEKPTPAVVSALVANHREFLAFLERRVGSRAIAEDILHEAFVRGLNKVQDIKNEESAVAWFYRMLRNAVVDHHRRNASSERRLQAFATELSVDTAPDTELQRTICQCVSSLAGTLKAEYSQALRRIEVDGIAVKDYAAEAGITSGNAAVRVHRAREALPCAKRFAEAPGVFLRDVALVVSVGERSTAFEPRSRLLRGKEPRTSGGRTGTSLSRIQSRCHGISTFKRVMLFEVSRSLKSPSGFASTSSR